MRFLLCILALVALFSPATAMQHAVRLGQPTMAIDAYTIPAVADRQAALDAGQVISLACQPLQGCPVWLAGHRSTHGSVFAQVATLVAGDTVRVLGVTYVVVDHQIICCIGDVFRPTADLTLQTSASSTDVHIVTARRTA